MEHLCGAQASDGDNWAMTHRCQDILTEKHHAALQYYTYVEIMPRRHQALWDDYEQVAEPPRPLRHAAHQRPPRHLSGVPRTVQRSRLA
jgi:uncharacterized sporulation protein YeaH/YhbH (DUF444 family)